MPNEEKRCHCGTVFSRVWNDSGKRGGIWHSCKAFPELFSGAGEQTLPSCSVCSPTEAEQGTLQARYRRLWHTVLGVPCVLFRSYICCAKGSCQGMEVETEFTSWGDSKKLLCMWNVIKEIKLEASVVILCGHQPSGDCSRQALAHICVAVKVHPLSPFPQMLLSFWWAWVEGHSKFCCKITV